MKMKIKNMLKTSGDIENFHGVNLMWRHFEFSLVRY